jgi:uncharacterized protein
MDAVPVHPGLLTDTAEGPRLAGGRCRVCRGHHFPATTTCPYCGAAGDDVTPVALSAEGVLWAFTAVTAPPPGYRGEVPFGFGVVELPEGIRVVSRLTEADPGAMAIGDPVRLVVAPLHVDDEGRTVTTWAFSPA